MGVLLPAGVVGGGEGDKRFGGGGEGEKALGLGEDGGDEGGGDVVVGDAEEADVFGGGDELRGYFVDSGVEVGERDCGDGAIEVFRC